MDIKLSAKIKNIPKRSVALGTLLAFFWTTVSVPFAEGSLWEERRKSLNETRAEKQQMNQVLSQSTTPALASTLISANLSSESSLNLAKINPAFELPSNLGTVVESWSRPTTQVASNISQGNPVSQGPLLIHIQDAHGNYGAQRNAALILQFIASQEKLRDAKIPLPVYVEGAWTKVYPQWVRAYPDPEIRKESAKILLKRGAITGEDYYAITSEQPDELSIQGIEEKDIYESNLRARKLVEPYRTEIKKQLQQMTEDLEKLKQSHYNKSLMDLDRLTSQFEEGKIDIKKYVQGLQSKASMDRFQNLSKLLRLMDQEDKIEVRQVESSAKNLTAQLGQKMDESALRQLTQFSLQYRLGQVAASNYYGTLVQLAQSQKLETQKLSDYVAYLKSAEAIDHEALMQELRACEEIALAATVSTQMDQIGKQQQMELPRLYKMSRILRLEKKFWTEKFAPADWKEYQRLSSTVQKYDGLQQLKDYLTASNAGLSQASLSQAGLAQASLAQRTNSKMPSLKDLRFLQESYYELAFKRDHVMSEQLVKNMDAGQKSKTAVFIAGGFHTSGMSQLLKKRGISYVVIRPNLEFQETEESPAKMRSARTETYKTLAAAYAKNLRSELKSAEREGDKFYAQKLKQILELVEHRLILASPVHQNGKIVVFGAYKGTKSRENFALIFTPKQSLEKKLFQKLSFLVLPANPKQKSRAWHDTLRAASALSSNGVSVVGTMIGAGMTGPVSEVTVQSVGNETVTAADSAAAAAWVKENKGALPLGAEVATKGNQITLSPIELPRTSSSISAKGSMIAPLLKNKGPVTRFIGNVLLMPTIETLMITVLVFLSSYDVFNIGWAFAIFAGGFLGMHAVIYLGAKGGRVFFDGGKTKFSAKIFVSQLAVWCLLAAIYSLPFVVGIFGLQSDSSTSIALMALVSLVLHAGINYIMHRRENRKNKTAPRTESPEPGPGPNVVTNPLYEDKNPIDTMVVLVNRLNGELARERAIASVVNSHSDEAREIITDLRYYGQDKLAKILETLIGTNFSSLESIETLSNVLKGDGRFTDFGGYVTDYKNVLTLQQEMVIIAGRKLIADIAANMNKRESEMAVLDDEIKTQLFESILKRMSGALANKEIAALHGILLLISDSSFSFDELASLRNLQADIQKKLSKYPFLESLNTAVTGRMEYPFGYLKGIFQDI